MRLIKEMVRVVLKLLFHVDTEAPTAELLENAEERAELETLLSMVDEGNINEAENRVFEIALAKDKANLEMILLFYSYLNEKPDDFLAENHFSRKEIQDDLKEILSQHGLGSMAEIYLEQ